MGMLESLQDHSLFLVADYEHPPEPNEYPKGVRWITIPIKRKIKPLQDLLALIKLFRIMRRERFDLVFSQTPKAGLLAMMASWASRMPLRIHVFTGQVWATKKGWFRRMLRSLDKLTSTCASEVLVDSPSQRDFLVGEGVITKNRSTVVADGSICGVDTQRFRPNPDAHHRIRTELGIPRGMLVFLFMGRMYREKGVFELVEAFRSLHANNPNTCLVCVGPDEEGIAAQLKEREGIFVHDFTNRPEDFFAASDVFCLPSHREGFGLVIIEAAACGVPAIGSNIYGISDAIVDGKTGLLHEVQNTTDLLRCMQQLAHDHNLRTRLGQQARDRAFCQFSKERVVGGYVAHITQRLCNLRKI